LADIFAVFASYLPSPATGVGIHLPVREQMFFLLCSFAISCGRDHLFAFTKRK